MTLAFSKREIYTIFAFKLIMDAFDAGTIPNCLVLEMWSSTWSSTCFMPDYSEFWDTCPTVPVSGALKGKFITINVIQINVIQIILQTETN